MIQHIARRPSRAAAVAILVASALVLVLYARHRPLPSLRIAWPSTTAAHAAPSGPPSLRVLSRAFGSPNAVAADGRWLYAAIGGRIEVYDAVDPADSAGPQLVGAVQGPFARIESLTVDAAVGRLYAALGGEGVAVVDITDPRRPVVEGVRRTAQWTARLALAGDVLLVADGHYGITALDVRRGALASSNARTNDGLAMPEVVGVWKPADDCDVIDILYRDPTIYALSKHDGVIVLDGRDPAHPVEITRTGVEGDEPTRMALDGDTLWVAATKGWWEVDVRDPAKPVVVGAGEGWDRAGLWPPEDIARRAGNWVFAGDGRYAFRIDDAAGAQALQALGITLDPPSEVWRGPANPVGDGSLLLAVDPTTLIVGSAVVDIGDAGRPRIVGEAGLPAGASAALDGHNIVVAGDGTDVAVFTPVAWPSGPWRRAGAPSCELTADDVIAAHGRAVVLNGYELAQNLWNSSLEIHLALLDTQSPTHPQVRSGYDLRPACGGDRRRAWASMIAQGLYGVGTPWANRIAGRLDPPELPIVEHAAFAPGERALVAVGEVALSGMAAAANGSPSGLIVLDLAELPAVHVVGALALPYPGDITLDGPLAYVTGPHSLRFVDLTDPHAPRLRGTFDWPDGPFNSWTWTHQAVVHGHHVLLAALDRIAALDMSDPDAPKLVADVNLGRVVQRLVVVGDVAWALLDGGELLALDLRP